jgi:F-type H+-transporting ATPase subunit delta
LIKYKVATKYAKALFELAKEEKVTDKILTDLSIVTEIFKVSKEFYIVMVGAIVSKEDKKDLLENIVKKFKLNKITENFLKILVDKRKIKFLPFIFNKYQKLYRDDIGIMVADIVSAIKLDNKKINEIKKNLESKLNKKLEINNKIDPDILGGIIVKTEGLTYDSSLKMQLTKIKENILKG